MKKFFAFIVLTLFTGAANAEFISYDTATTQTKPYAMLVYANWADSYNTAISTITQASQQYGDKYNFVLMDIASKDAKSFNKTSYIYPNLPYVILMRGKISRFLKTDCAIDYACLTDKLQLFAN